ncbi:MAG: type II secretion system protein GspE [Deltaproteobacteria bacterium]|nr:type II secretion system protein GspE [Deltaproteobacteria bacterium]
MKTKKLGEILVDAGLITDKQLNAVLKHASREKGKRFGTILVEQGLAKEEDIAQTLAYQLNLPYVDALDSIIAPEAVKLVPEKLALEYNIMPLYMDKSKFVIAMSDPLNLYALNDLRFASNFEVCPVISTEAEITVAIKKHYNLSLPLDRLMKDVEREKAVMVVRAVETSGDVSDLIKQSKTPPVIKMVDSIIINSVERKASDIHIEPHKRIVKLRMRIDGLMTDITQIPKWVQASIVSRIKIMAEMDIAERRLPQDGRIKIILDNKELDLRVSTLPTQYGEKVVMRLLDPQASILTLDEIGVLGSEKERLKEVLESPQGILLVTGPTGSGKTSSLYAMLQQVKNDRINIVTLEDPIEYELAGINQVHINEKTGLSFAYCLRAILRQDPDVIFVGEMRDVETANIAFQASITGHLVFSTIHTLDAASSITRLRNMNMPSYLIASALNGIVAQRLVRRVCHECKAEYTPTESERLSLKALLDDGEEPTFLKGEGCKSCGYTGYRGRVGIFELLVIDGHIREMIQSDAKEDEIRRAAVAGGMVSLCDDGLRKVKQGITTFEELKRVVGIHRDMGREMEDEEERPLAVIEDEPELCPWCSKSVDADLQTCGHCHSPLVSKCPSCNRMSQPAWRLCPFCGTALEG